MITLLAIILLVAIGVEVVAPPPLKKDNRLAIETKVDSSRVIFSPSPDRTAVMEFGMTMSANR